MQTRTNLPKDLPLLPGNQYADPTVTRYHKMQLLGVKDGAITEQTRALEEQIDSQLLTSMRLGEPMKLAGVPARRTQENDAIPRVAPKWLKNDRHVLKFEGYFQEAVVEDPTENFRLRKCIIYFYLDDDTVHILEPRVENSGIPQGIFLKRHRVPHPTAARNYDWFDFNVGVDFEVYGRVFRIVRCDDFTRNFFANEGRSLNADEAFPDDPFVHTRAMVNMKQNPPDLAETKEYVEVLNKGGRPNKNLQQYLENDRQVLSFKILWDDVTYDGGEKPYVLNYFLADSQIEVKEIRVQNSGKDPFPMMLKRQKVPLKPNLTHYPGMSLNLHPEFYGPEHIRCGSTVNIYGRECLVYDCDEFTRQWYRTYQNYEQQPMQLKKARPNVMYQAMPSYNGFGTEEDSLGSVYSLQPNPPKKDVKKMFKSDMHILRFDAKLVSTEPDDENRKFLVSFFCGDDTIQVYEICDKNSGRLGGKFLERKKHKNPVSGAYYEEKDFLLGTVIYVGGWKFMLCKADEYTEKYFEDNPEVFPEASIDHVLTKVRKGAKNYASMQDYAIDLLRKLDKNNDGVIGYGEFREGMKELKIFLTDHEMHTLVRRFDHNLDGKITMEEFYNTLASA